MEKSEKIIIECECGAHLLMVQSNTEIFDETNSNSKRPRVRQDFYLAMFGYGKYRKHPSFWRRLKIIWNFLKSGEMHLDQLILHPDEAQKLVDFLNEQIVPTEKE